MRRPCELLVEAIAAAGYAPGNDIAIALDPAASSFYAAEQYHLEKSRQGQKTSAELTDLYASWVDRFPIVSLEDGLADTGLGRLSPADRSAR